MIIVNSEAVAGRNIASVHGLVMGNTIRSNTSARTSELA